jgi:hypothetical protein
MEDRDAVQGWGCCISKHPLTTRSLIPVALHRQWLLLLIIRFWRFGCHKFAG